MPDPKLALGPDVVAKSTVLEHGDHGCLPASDHDRDGIMGEGGNVPKCDAEHLARLFTAGALAKAS